MEPLLNLLNPVYVLGNIVREADSAVRACDFSQVSSAPHSSSSLTPLGNWADSRATRGERRKDPDGGQGWEAGAPAVTIGVSGIATTGMNTDAATCVSSLAAVFDCSCKRTHLCNWLAFTPALRASADSDVPGWRQASISRFLSIGSKLRLPPTPTRVTRSGKKLRSSCVMDCVRKIRLRTQS